MPNEMVPSDSHVLAARVCRSRGSRNEDSIRNIPVGSGDGDSAFEWLSRVRLGVV